MDLDLKGKDYKNVENLFVMTDTLEVYNSNGVLLGKLSSDDFPRTRDGILDNLKLIKKKEPKAEKPKPVKEKKGLSLHSMKHPEPTPTFKNKPQKVKVEKKAPRKRSK